MNITLTATKEISMFQIADLLHLGDIHCTETSDKEQAFYKYDNDTVIVSFTKQKDLFTVERAMKFIWDITKH